jgi:hypothetical protein
LTTSPPAARALLNRPTRATQELLLEHGEPALAAGGGGGFLNWGQFDQGVVTGGADELIERMGSSEMSLEGFGALVGAAGGSFENLMPPPSGPHVTAGGSEMSLEGFGASADATSASASCPLCAGATRNAGASCPLCGDATGNAGGR